MKNVELLLKDGRQVIQANMIVNDMGNSVEIIVASDIFYLKTVDEYPFFALVKMRLELESKGYYVLVNGSRYNVYPSGMQYDTFSAYEIEFGKQATNTVNIFDRITTNVEVAIVKEQEEYFCKWIESIGGVV